MATSVFLGQGDVTGPSSATSGNVAVFDGTTGKLIKDGGAGGAFVASITGTANQITASAATGAVTLSIPSTFIAPGTIEAVTSVSSPIYTGAGGQTLIMTTADVTELRRGTNAQTFGVYRTYTSATSYERLVLGNDAAEGFLIQSEKGSGGGSARAINFGTDATRRWLIGGTTGHWLAAVNNTYDIGDGSFNPRTVRASTSFIVGNTTLSTNALTSALTGTPTITFSANTITATATTVAVVGALTVSGAATLTGGVTGGFNGTVTPVTTITVANGIVTNVA